MVADNESGKSVQSALRTSCVKPVKGDTLLFFSPHPDATTDSDSLHGSCPVIEGQKWSATKWIHVRSFELPVKQSASDRSEDDKQWAAVGECAKNPNYIGGDQGSTWLLPEELQSMRRLFHLPGVDRTEHSLDLEEGNVREARKSTARTLILCFVQTSNTLYS